MFFSADDDDQDFVSSGGGSKLANLFGMDKASGKGGNSSLTYTAPKEPKKKAEAAPAQQGGSPAVVVASVVQAYKYVDNKYASQGKLGAALLANHSAKDYRILLYVNKQQQVTNAKITAAFAFNIQENNYASFYDDARQTWSLLFDSAENAQKFAKEIAIAKANSVAETLTDVVKQDVALGEGGPLDFGDSVEVKYTGWLLTNFALHPTPFDSNATSDKLFRFKVGKGKVIKGWDQGMVGLKKGGKRVLVIPPSLGYGAQGVADRIPANSTLVFEVEAVRVKLAKGDSTPQESPASTPAPTPAPAATVPALPMESDDLEEAGVKGRTKSINEQLTHTQAPNSNKAKLISRMARMGQPMLPFQGAVPAQPDEEEMEADMQQQQQMEEQQHHHHHQQQQQQQHNQAFAGAKPALPSKPTAHPQVVMTQAGVAMVTNQQAPVMVGDPMMVGGVAQPQPLQQAQYQQQPQQFQQPQQQQQQQQQPAFLQNLPGAQQLAVYQNPNAILQQQQQHPHLLQQQQPQVMGMSQAMPTQAPVYSAPPPPPPTNPIPTPTSSADSLAPVLLTETRQQNTEVRLSISKMSDKVDQILSKVEQMHPGMMGAAGVPSMGVMSPYPGGMAAPTMEANVLMQNITRIVQDNERLKKEVYEQSGKVQEQNEKINTLLEKNQKYVEQSQNLLEQRNEGYKNSASQSQARVLTLEQEKVSLATELSTASAQITTLQLELGDYRKREGELKQKLQLTSSTGNEAKEELERLRLAKDEYESKISVLTSTLREEKVARKQVEAKMSQHHEELLDLKATSETLERNLVERKKKSAEERRKLEEDMEDAKINYETTIEGLREKLRRQKTSTDAETESKVSKIEEEISQDWQQKSERMLALATEKHNRQLADAREEKEELAAKLAQLERKLASVRSSGSNTEQQVNELRDELEEANAWKGKYDNLRKQASSMKEKYEKRIQELETEKEEEEEKLQEAEEKGREQRQQLLQQLQQLRSQQKTSIAPVQAGSPPMDVTTEVKKIMNKVFQTLRGEIEAGQSYQGSQVLATILNVIKQTTLELVSGPSAKQEKDEEEEDEDTEEEEEEETEEEEEEEEEEKEGENKDSSEATKSEEAQSRTEVPPKPQTTPPSETKEQKPETVPETPPSASATTTTPNTTQVSNSETPPQPSSVPSNPKPSPPLSSSPPSPSAQSAASQPSPPEDDVGMPAEKQAAVDQSADQTEGSEDVNASTAQSVEVDKKLEAESQSQSHSPSSVSDHVAVMSENEVEKPVTAAAEDDFPDRKTVQDASSLPEKEKEAGNAPGDFTEDKQGTSNSTNGVKEEKEKDKEDDDDDMFSPVKEEKKATPPAPQTKAAESSSKKDTPVSPGADTTSREPPPLFDDDDEEDGPLFGKDSNVADTFGPAFESKSRTQSTVSSKSETASGKAGTTPAKKMDLGLDEDNKPQPPPPLFGDDSDDDDLDWLS